MTRCFFFFCVFFFLGKVTLSEFCSRFQIIYNKLKSERQKAQEWVRGRRSSFLLFLLLCFVLFFVLFLLASFFLFFLSASSSCSSLLAFSLVLPSSLLPLYFFSVFPFFFFLFPACISSFFLLLLFTSYCCLKVPAAIAKISDALAQSGKTIADFDTNKSGRVSYTVRKRT